MTSASKVPLVERIKTMVDNKMLAKPYAYVISEWYKTYQDAASKSKFANPNPEQYTERMFSTLIDLVQKQIESPYKFDCYHERLRAPFDYYKFGVDFARPLVDFANSRLGGIKNLNQAAKQIKAGDNVVFLANHQSEGDPHAVDVLISELAHHNELAGDMVFMAGDRVREDTLVVPFSLGRNLLTVYSKKHINDKPELKEEKQNHNRRTIKETENLFKEGGCCLWFAPSGGRDRRSTTTGKVEIAPFDPDAVEMMRFTAMKAKSGSGKDTHFYPMSLATYPLLPPPETVDKDLGERRVVKFTPLGLAIGKEIDWDHLLDASVAASTTDKNELRGLRAKAITKQVEDEYRKIGGYDQ